MTTTPARWIPVTYTDADPPQRRTSRATVPRAAQMAVIGAGAVALALAAWLAAVVFMRVTGAVTIGAVPVDAATDARLYTAGEVRATVEAAVVLNAGAGDALPPLPHAGTPDDGTSPSWLPAGLSRWWPEIVQAAHANGLDSHAWGAIVAQECPWGDPACGSHAGARGLAQIMPATAAEIEGATGLPCRAMATDGPMSLRCGAWYYAERVRTQADLWTEGNDEPALLVAAGLYNGGSCGLGIRRAVLAGASDVCAAATCGETRTYCYAFRDRWRATLAERTGGAAGFPTARRLEAMTDG